MAEWSTFIGIVGVVLVLLLALTHASKSVFESESTDHPTTATDRPPAAPDAATGPVDGSDSVDDSTTVDGSESVDTERADSESIDNERLDPGDEAVGRPVTTGSTTEPDLSTPVLLVNVAVSQGVFAVLVVVMAWYTEIPAWAFGLTAESLTLGAVGMGVAVGGVFYLGNEAAAAFGRRWGLSTPTELREALAPETATEWALLLGVVLPIIAGFEELLFRGALIGVVHAGFAVPVWLLAVGSSVAFALGHSAQGRLGVVVTGLLGLGLAAVFVYTGSLLVVIVAHYVVNALEFVVHEGLDVG